MRGLHEHTFLEVLLPVSWKMRGLECVKKHGQVGISMECLWIFRWFSIEFALGKHFWNPFPTSFLSFVSSSLGNRSSNLFDWWAVVYKNTFGGAHRLGQNRLVAWEQVKKNGLVGDLGSEALFFCGGGWGSMSHKWCLGVVLNMWNCARDNGLVQWCGEMSELVQTLDPLTHAACSRIEGHWAYMGLEKWWVASQELALTAKRMP